MAIAHSSLQNSSISAAQLRRIFAARQQVWEAGGKIVVVMQEHNSRPHSMFCRQYLNLFPYQIERRWNQLVFSGQAEAPIISANDEATVNIVASTPGAIGYVDDALSLPDNVRKLTINEKDLSND